MASSSSSSSTTPSLKGPVDTLMIDNYDSFTYNLVQYLEELGADVVTIRNDAITVKEIEEVLQPKRIIISPGPGNPKEAGVSMDVIRAFGGKIPIFGVCLGLQCIYEVYGGTVTHAGEWGFLF
jgi:anthranilate synthase/indole-3-glycerol phosphate synthase/phosphoribosylanthranilate isomerase